MTIEEALKKSKIGERKWAVFKKIAQDNTKVKEIGFAYVGGMRDALWALSGSDYAVYSVLNDNLLVKDESRT